MERFFVQIIHPIHKQRSENEIKLIGFFFSSIKKSIKELLENKKDTNMRVIYINFWVYINVLLSACGIVIVAN